MKKFIIIIATTAVFFSCNSNKSADYADGSIKTATAENESVSDSTVTAKVIKTADMRFRVKDVQSTKEKLSETIKAQGGTVAEFAIQSNIQQTDKVAYSADSLKEITSYRTDGLLIAKIPSEKLDDFTNLVAKMAVFVDNQGMKMDDQSIAYLANKLKAQNRVDALNQINKTATRKGNNVETSLYVKDDYVDKKIENMNIDDKVKFSTITLNFYQDNTIKTFIVGNDNLHDYRPGFFQRLGLNMVAGWSFFKEFLLGLSTLWMVFVLGFVAFLTVRFFVKRNKLAMAEATRNLMNNHPPKS